MIETHRPYRNRKHRAINSLSPGVIRTPLAMASDLSSYTTGALLPVAGGSGI